MADGPSFQIRISAAQGGVSKNLTIAELGVLLTGINRALNKAPGIEVDFDYSPQSQEPLRVRSEVTRVDNGSVLLTIVTSVNDFTQQNIMQGTFLAGILGSAAWDFTKVLSKEILRALRRIGSRVAEVNVRVEPSLEYDRTPDSIESEIVAPESSTREVGHNTLASASPAHPMQTMYSVSFEQKGAAIIAISFSAFDRG